MAVYGHHFNNNEKAATLLFTEFHGLMEDADFHDAITQATNDMQRVRTRFKKAEEAIKRVTENVDRN